VPGTSKGGQSYLPAFFSFIDRNARERRKARNNALPQAQVPGNFSCSTLACRGRKFCYLPKLQSQLASPFFCTLPYAKIWGAGKPPRRPA